MPLQLFEYDFANMVAPPTLEQVERIRGKEGTPQIVNDETERLYQMRLFAPTGAKN